MILLLVLAIADTMDLWFVTLTRHGIYGLLPFSSSVWPCRGLVFTFLTAATTSSWLIVTISAGRTIAMLSPLKFQIYCTSKNTLSVITIITVVMSIINLPVFFTGNINQRDNMYYCHFHVADSLFEVIHVLAFGILYSILPFCIILILNIMMIRKIYSQRKFRLKYQKQQQGKSPKSYNLTATMFAVCIVFVITTVPSAVNYLITTMTKFLGNNDDSTLSFEGFIAYKLDSI